MRFINHAQQVVAVSVAVRCSAYAWYLGWLRTLRVSGHPTLIHLKEGLTCLLGVLQCESLAGVAGLVACFGVSTLHSFACLILPLGIAFVALFGSRCFRAMASIAGAEQDRVTLS